MNSCTTSCPSWKMAQPRIMLVLLLGFQLLVTPASQVQEEGEKSDINVASIFFPPTLEFVMNTFNQQSKDEYAYRLVQILSAWKEKVDFTTVFSMKVQLGRTICRKFEENIDICPFQDSPEQQRTFTCYFTVSTYPWITTFKLLKQLCSK